MNLLNVVDEKVNIVQIISDLRPQTFYVLDPSMDTCGIWRLDVGLFKVLWCAAVLLEFLSEEFIKFVVEVLEEICFLVTHCTVDVNVLNISIVEDLFEKSGFARGSRAVDEEVHSGFQEPG